MSCVLSLGGASVYAQRVVTAQYQAGWGWVLARQVLLVQSSLTESGSKS